MMESSIKLRRSIMLGRRFHRRSVRIGVLRGASSPAAAASSDIIVNGSRLRNAFSKGVQCLQNLLIADSLSCRGHCRFALMHRASQPRHRVAGRRASFDGLLHA